MPEFLGQMPLVEPDWSTMGLIHQVKVEGAVVELQAARAMLRVSVLAANLIRIRLAPDGKFWPRRSWAVTCEDTAWAQVPYQVEETAQTVTIRTAQLDVIIHKSTGAVQFLDQQQREFAQDAGLGMAWRGQTIACWKQINPAEHFYGFGERTGLLDKIGRRLTNWTIDALDHNVLTDEMYQAIPCFVSLQPQIGYGIFLNSTHWSRFDMGADQAGVYRMETRIDAGMAVPELDYYLIYGPQPAQILETYTALTGRMPLPPKWALGYHQCRWSYRSEQEVRQLAQEFRQRQIPCDVIHLDIDYMNGFRVFTWNPDRFPNPAALIQDLDQEGFRIVTIVDPGVKFEPDDPYEVLETGLAENYFVRHRNGRILHGYVWPDRSVFPDFMRAEVRQWWGDCQQALTDAGVAGIWNDMNEPAFKNRPFGDPGEHIPFPLDTPQGDPTELSNHAETHNLYGLMMARAAAEGLEKLRPNQRSFVLTRSGYAGVQRWSSVWTGDNHSRWEYLEMSLPMLCNLGLSGVAFVGADIGGFSGNATAELFARWMQVGVLYPLMRAHTVNESARHEPWCFGEKIEQICRQYIELRYQLLPYLYTLFWQASVTGAPILRPLLYEFPNDPQTSQLADQVMLGGAIMAAPVLRPGVEYRAVYLPEGTWFDWWTGERFTGPQHMLVQTPLHHMPLYVRAGSIVPLAPVMQHVRELPVTHLRIKVWSGTGEWTLYEDDAESWNYRQGEWATTSFRVRMQAEQTIVEIGERQGQWQPPSRQITVEVVGVGERSFTDDGTARQLSFNF
jgi:alpha-glucosidase